MAPDLVWRHLYLAKRRVDRNLFRADLGTPLIETTLPTVDDVGQYHAANREDQYTDENFVGLERCAGDRDHKADAGCGGIQLTYHDTDERAADSQAKTSENKRHRRG